MMQTGDGYHQYIRPHIVCRDQKILRRTPERVQLLRRRKGYHGCLASMRDNIDVQNHICITPNHPIHTGIVCSHQ